MAKDTRRIIETVRTPGRYDKNRRTLAEPKAFGPGEEDELAQVLTPAQGERMLKAGAIEGDWQFQGKEPQTEPEAGQLLQAVAGLTSAATDPSETAAGYISSTFGIERSSDETGAEFLELFVAEAREDARERDRLSEEATSHVAVLEAASKKLLSAEKARDTALLEVKQLKVELQQAKKPASTPASPATPPTDEAAS